MAAAHAEHHDPHVAHHFENADQQLQSAKLGMWIFLATEILFFGGLFCAYAVYRANHPEIFLYAHHFLDTTLGAVNTVILICSSFTMAWAVRAAQLRQQRILALMLMLTLACSFGFLGVKYVEYHHKWEHGLLWAEKYAPDVHHGTAVDEGAEGHPAERPQPLSVTGEGADAPRLPLAGTGPEGLAEQYTAGDSEALPLEPKNAQVFFSIYFLMTGLHGVHVLGGMGAMVWLLWLVGKGFFRTAPANRVDMVGLYWHLVDLIWIYLFLLLYLIH